MLCPDCGADVVDKAVFCHSCGKRLDSQEQQFPPRDDGLPESEQANDEQVAPESALDKPPAERFKEAVQARQSDGDVETQLWQGGYCPKAMLGTWVFTTLVSAIVLAVGIWLSVSESTFVKEHLKVMWIVVLGLILLLWLYQLLKLCFRRLDIRYTLTTQRFIHESGVLRRLTNRIELIDIDDITVSQGVFDRVVGVGTVTITSSDVTDPKLLMPGIENVQEIANLIDETRRAERRRRGLHIESI
jgi:membrane protein YdbS with pleckstrin-like domain